MQDVFGVLTVDRRVAQVDEHQVHVSAAGEHVDARRLRVGSGEPLGEDLRAAHRALLAFLELGLRGELERGRLGGDHVHERSALLTGEDVGVELLLGLEVVGEDEARARTTDRLVHGGAGDIREGHRARVQAGRHEAREVRHVDPQLGADLIGDRTERGEVELAGVGAPAGDEHVRLDLEGLRAHGIHVDEVGRGVNAVGVSLVELAGEVEVHAVGEVTALVEGQAQDAVAGGRDRGEHGGVGRGTGVRLHVGVGGAEQALGAADREGLGDVDEFASAVVAAARVALCVLVGEHGALRLEHRAGNEVLAGDHLERAALAVELLLQNGGDLRIDFGQRGIEDG